VANQISVQHLKIIALVFGLLIVSGCAHKNLVNSGNELMMQQQYELAVAKYRAASKEQPDNEKTKQQLRHAKAQLISWGQNLALQAQIAQENQQLEKALVLYAKAFQITRDPNSNQQYKALYKQLRNNTLLHVSINNKGVPIAPALIQATEGLHLVKQGATQLKMSQSDPIFEIQQSSKTLETQYISGSQIIANPELVELQHAINQNQHRQRDNQKDFNRLSRYVTQLASNERSLSSQLNSVQRRLANTSLSPADKTKLQQQLSSINTSLAKATNQRIDRQASLREVRDHRAHLQQTTNGLAHNLAHLSPTVEVPIYSDYQYRVQQQSNSLTSTIYLSVNNQIRPASISVESTDISHPAHPTIDLAANPMIVSSQAQLSPLLAQQRENVLRRLLGELVDERRLGFFYQSKQTIDSDQQLSLLIKHGLMTRNGALKEASDTIKKMLILEYGQGGEFTINQLLHLYP